MHSDLIVFIIGSFLLYLCVKCDVRSTVTVDHGCQSDHVTSLFSEVSDELTLYHHTHHVTISSVMTCIHASDEL